VDWQIEAFAGKKPEYYKEKWAKKFSINWAGFFFTWLWFFHRKMYREAIITAGAFFAVRMVLELLGPGWEPLVWVGSGPVFSVGIGQAWVSLLLRGGIGAYSNIFYRDKFVRALKKSEGMEREAREQYLSQNGGVSPAWKTIVFFWVSFTLAVIVNSIINSLLQ